MTRRELIRLFSSTRSHNPNTAFNLLYCFSFIAINWADSQRHALSQKHNKWDALKTTLCTLTRRMRKKHSGVWTTHEDSSDHHSSSSFEKRSGASRRPKAPQVQLNDMCWSWGGFKGQWGSSVSEAGILLQRRVKKTTLANSRIQSHHLTDNLGGKWDYIVAQQFKTALTHFPVISLILK